MVKKYLFFLVLMSVFACNDSLSTKEKEVFLKKGSEIAQATLKELSGHLIQQMKLGGPEQAIPFCNIQAMQITSKTAKIYDVTIKRTSNKIRNPENIATDRELEIIKEYQSAIDSKKEIFPKIELDIEGNKHFYAPIKINSKCLSCHGEIEKKLSVKTYSLIKIKYPKDKAIGYKDGDLRGIWSITFDEKTK